MMIPINERLPRVLEYRDSFHKPVRVVFRAITSYFLLKGNNLTFFFPFAASSSVSFFNYCYIIMS